MKLNATSEYAIRLLAKLADSFPAFVQTKQLSNELSIPYKYISHIVTLLVKGGIVDSKKGKIGGIALAKHPSLITLKSVLICVDDYKNDACIVGVGYCNSNDKCILHDIWQEPKQKILNVFENTTLEQLTNIESIAIKA